MICKAIRKTTRKYFAVEAAKHGKYTRKADNKLHKVFEHSFDWKPAWRQTGNAEHRHSYNRN
jgi:hypothetical protein